MELHELKPNFGAKQKTQRRGRGNGSGRGNYSGKGNKGQNARSGGTRRPGFEGGQTPLYKRMPKLKGFKNPTRVDFQVVNVGDLDKFAADDVITMESLLANNLIAKKDQPVKLLGDGAINKAITIEIHKASASAIAKVEQAGGKVKLLIAPATTSTKEKK